MLAPKKFGESRSSKAITCSPVFDGNQRRTIPVGEVVEVLACDETVCFVEWEGFVYGALVSELNPWHVNSPVAETALLQSPETTDFKTLPSE